MNKTEMTCNCPTCGRITVSKLPIVIHQFSNKVIGFAFACDHCVYGWNVITSNADTLFAPNAPTEKQIADKLKDDINLIQRNLVLAVANYVYDKEAFDKVSSPHNLQNMKNSYSVMSLALELAKQLK